MRTIILLLAACLAACQAAPRPDTEHVRDTLIIRDSSPHDTLHPLPHPMPQTSKPAVKRRHVQ